MIYPNWNTSTWLALDLLDREHKLQAHEFLLRDCVTCEEVLRELASPFTQAELVEASNAPDENPVYKDEKRLEFLEVLLFKLSEQVNLDAGTLTAVLLHTVRRDTDNEFILSLLQEQPVHEPVQECTCQVLGGVYDQPVVFFAGVLTCKTCGGLL